MHKTELYARLLTSTLAVSAVLLLGACQTTQTAHQNGGKPTAKQAANNVSERLDTAFAEAIDRAETSNNPQESIKIFEEILTLKPNDPDISIRYARALRNDGQLQVAKKVLKPFISGEQPYPEALTEMAMIHLSEGDFKNAELRARETITILPENGRAFLALGTALDAQEYHEQAETAFRRGIEYWRGDPAPILNNLALNLASQGKLDEAIKVLERARKTSPNRMEIERNYRIISTLRETTAPAAPKPNAKPDTPAEKVEPAAASSVAPVKTHARPQPVLENDPALENPKPVAEKKKAEKKTTVKVVPVKNSKKDSDKEQEAEVQAPSDENLRAPVLLGPRTIQNWKN